MQQCAVETCGRGADGSRGWCRSHYMRWWKSGDVRPDIPLEKRRPAPESCAVVGCERFANKGPHCSPHGRRLARWGTTGPADVKPREKRMRQPRLNNDGYRMVRADGHPNAYSTGTILEHRFVMSKLLGRPLLPEETVHHRNGDRLDNRPENLELWNNRHPKGQRVEDLLEWARSIVALYGDDCTQNTLVLDT